MATTGDNAPSVFSKFIDKPEQEPKPPPSTPLAAGRLLEWLQRWPEPTVTTRNICQFGPRPTRDKDSTLKLTAVLERGGWIVPVKARNYNAKMWRIAIGAD